MNRSVSVYLGAIILCITAATSCMTQAQSPALKLVQTMPLAGNITGNFDHFGVDLKRNRLFVTPEDSGSVLVLDISSGGIVHRIDGLVRPHAILYRQDTDSLYVTDGGDGSVKVFSGETYRPIARIPLLKDADSIGYDISRHYLYVDNGGGDVGQTFSMLSVIDTATNAKLSDLRIQGDTLEAMALDNYRPHIYINDKATSEIVVVDRLKNKMIARWPVTMGHQNVAIALDEFRQRLFVGCRSGQVVVIDSNTGKELKTLPIHKGIDDLVYDPMTRRLYASTDGFVDVFEQTDLNAYASRGSVSTGSNARTERLVPELDRLFVAVPKGTTQHARILVFQPSNTSAPLETPVDVKEPVNAPVAEQLVLEELSQHPQLRRMGLHVIPPGQHTMILIANGNATRLGIHTSPGDFAAVEGGKTYGPRIADGDFYNMKMPMFDAEGRSIGILVMEIPCTYATSEQDAARKAESIRAELAKKIPSLNALFSAPPTT